MTDALHDHPHDAHVLPIQPSTRPHQPTRRCWCQPRFETINPETGQPYSSGVVVMHRRDVVPPEEETRP